jgi:molecular chaperone GrpE
MELVKSGGEDILKNIIPVVDNFERGLKAMQTARDLEAVKEGMVLIYNNFIEFLAQKGVKPMTTLHQTFDTDMHEALTKIPAPTEDLKGKVVDEIEKGYTLNDKVIRFAKVVVGD